MTIRVTVHGVSAAGWAHESAGLRAVVEAMTAAGWKLTPKADREGDTATIEFTAP